MTMTSIYLVRHGQTAWNKEEIFRGRTDIPLDETGLRQAELAGQYFKDLKVHGIYSSPLTRAWQTAERIAQFHPPEGSAARRPHRYEFWQMGGACP